jgi:AcrR family transcriptional regulator
MHRCIDASKANWVDMGRIGKTQQDWVRGGQALLIADGIDAVKLHCLTRKLGVSTGSFYHHFKNFDEYLAALAEFYGSEQAQLPFDEARSRTGDDPEALLREATTIFGVGSMRQLNIAMRAWGQRDERAAAAIQRYDAVLIRNLDGIFQALGFDEIAAKSRSLIMMGLASLDLDPSLMQPSFRERWVYIRDQLILPNANTSSSSLGGDTP